MLKSDPRKRRNRLSQQRYSKELLKKYSLHYCNPTQTQMSNNISFSSEKENKNRYHLSDIVITELKAKSYYTSPFVHNLTTLLQYVPNQKVFML